MKKTVKKPNEVQTTTDYKLEEGLKKCEERLFQRFEEFIGKLKPVEPPK